MSSSRRQYNDSRDNGSRKGHYDSSANRGSGGFGSGINYERGSSYAPRNASTKQGNFSSNKYHYQHYDNNSSYSSQYRRHQDEYYSRQTDNKSSYRDYDRDRDRERDQPQSQHRDRSFTRQNHHTYQKYSSNVVNKETMDGKRRENYYYRENRYEKRSRSRSRSRSSRGDRRVDKRQNERWNGQLDERPRPNQYRESRIHTHKHQDYSSRKPFRQPSPSVVVQQVRIQLKPASLHHQQPQPVVTTTTTTVPDYGRRDIAAVHVDNSQRNQKEMHRHMNSQRRHHQYQGKSQVEKAVARKIQKEPRRHKKSSPSSSSSSSSSESGSRSESRSWSSSSSGSSSQSSSSSSSSSSYERQSRQSRQDRQSRSSSHFRRSLNRKNSPVGPTGSISGKDYFRPSWAAQPVRKVSRSPSNSNNSSHVPNFYQKPSGSSSLKPYNEYQKQHQASSSHPYSSNPNTPAPNQQTLPSSQKQFRFPLPQSSSSSNPNTNPFHQQRSSYPHHKPYNHYQPYNHYHQSGHYHHQRPQQQQHSSYQQQDTVSGSYTSFSANSIQQTPPLQTYAQRLQNYHINNNNTSNPNNANYNNVNSRFNNFATASVNSLPSVFGGANDTSSWVDGTANPVHNLNPNLNYNQSVAQSNRQHIPSSFSFSSSELPNAADAEAMFVASKVKPLTPSKTLGKIHQAKKNLAIAAPISNFVILDCFANLPSYKIEMLNEKWRNKLNDDMSKIQAKKAQIFQNLRIINPQKDENKSKDIETLINTSQKEVQKSETMKKEVQKKQQESTEKRNQKLDVDVDVDAKPQTMKEQQKDTINHQSKNILYWKKPVVSESLAALRSSIDNMRKSQLLLNDLVRKMKIKV